MLEILVLKGLVEVIGIDPASGEFLYRVSQELKDQYPQIEEEQRKSFVDNIDALWIRGMLQMDRTAENPIVTLTDLAFDQERIDSLSTDERTTLYFIMEAMRRKKQED